jgi:hypothetical protein
VFLPLDTLAVAALSLHTDFGVGFYGHALNSGSYLVQHPTQGFQCFLCDATTKAPTKTNAVGSVVTVHPRDSFHRRVYIAPLGLDIVSEAGSFESVTIDFAERKLTVLFNTTAAENKPLPPRARVRLEAPAPTTATRTAHDFTSTAPLIRGAHETELVDGGHAEMDVTWVG